MKRHGWVGLAIMAGAEAILYAGGPRLGLGLFVATFFTPIMWTGYILLIDGWVAARAGASWLTSRRREFGFLAVLSVLSWLVFEVYNLKLANWAYVGMPPQPWLRDLGFLWSFATITPAMFETADGLAAAWHRRPLWPELVLPAPLAEEAAPRGNATPPGGDAAPARLYGRRRNQRDGVLAVWAVLGLACVAVPPALPDWLAAYTIAFIWVGFIFLLEPALFYADQPSMLHLWLTGHGRDVWRWLLAGLICGFIWELWNVQTLAHGGAGWLYTMPSAIHNLVFGLHYGKMPVIGLLGFPPFALESFAIYYFLRWALRLEAFLPKIEQSAQ